MVNTIHPMLVHFPIAILIITGIIALIDLLKSKFQLKKVVVWNLAFATIGTIFTVVSGFKDANVIAHNETIHEIMEVHEKIGIVILIITSILAIWMVLRINKMKKTENILFVIILWVSMVLVGYNGYLGGKMVFDNGAGVKILQKTVPVEEHEHNH